VKYTWDASTGVQLQVENISTGETQTVGSDTTGLTMDIGDNDDESWQIGVRESDDGQYDHFFDGSIDYMAIYEEEAEGGGPVESTDGNGGDVTGTLEYSEIETIVPCFTPDTMIATMTGEKLVEDLKVGDRVITRDNGAQEIRWLGNKPMSGAQLQANPHLQPVLVRKGSLGGGLPERDMLVSPNHRMLINNAEVGLLFNEPEVLVAAKHLINADKGITSVAASQTTYIHFMFDHHEVVLSNGAWTESFQPGDQAMSGVSKEQRSEIVELFPELANAEGREAFASSRLSLKAFEAKMLK
jgi:hypothetical protein